MESINETLLTLLIIHEAGNNGFHYFPLCKINKDNNVIITWVKKIKKLLPFFTHSGLNKVYISLASLGEIKNLWNIRNNI